MEDASSWRPLQPKVSTFCMSMYISSPSKSSQLFIFKYKNRKPYLPARTSFVVNCTKPSVRPEGPKGHMQNWDTYFYNTIPRRVATFDIHQDSSIQFLDCVEVFMTCYKSSFNENCLPSPQMFRLIMAEQLAIWFKSDEYDEASH